MDWKRDGKVLLHVFGKRGWETRSYQRYRCALCRCARHNAQLFGMFTTEMIEWAAYIYIRSMSLENTRDIIRATFSMDVLSKDVLLGHMEKLADTLPSLSDVTRALKPSRSGYYAWDGTWFKLNGEDRVLLICFDVRTLDLVGSHVADDETYYTYCTLLEKINNAEPGIMAQSRGFFADGERGLLKLLKERFSHTPIQLCAFHKYARIGQIVPFVRPKEIDKHIKGMTEAVIFAPTKSHAMMALLKLKRYAQEHHTNKKLKKVIGVLKQNFDLLLTHFDHPEMSPYNNVLEGFNHIIKRKLRLMKGFKKEQNIDRWMKLILLEYRFHEIRSSKFKSRNGKSPLQLAQVELPKIYNWINFIRKDIGS